jgi:ribosomal protein L31
VFICFENSKYFMCFFAHWNKNNKLKKRSKLDTLKSIKTSTKQCDLQDENKEFTCENYRLLYSSEYPVFKMEISRTSHPFYTGKS